MAYTTIDDSSAHFQVLTYRGDSSSTTTADRTLTNDGNSDLQPDLVWIANRDSVTNSGQRWWDSTRGVGENKGLTSSGSNAEGGPNDPEYGYVNTLHSDGFGVRAGANDSNGRWTTDRGEGGGDKYVAWQWKANGGTTTSVSASGSGASRVAASTYQADTTSKFSICSWTGTDDTAAATITHGLGVAPELILIKRRSDADDWTVYHHKNTTAPETDILVLNTTAATSDNDRFNDTAPTSTVFSVNASSSPVNANGETYVAYCWAGVQGYSKFGEYDGSGTDGDGPFVYTGFKPAWIMLKPTDTAIDWFIFDNRRQAEYNEAKSVLFANTTSAGSGTTYRGVDFVSNGFKIRNGGTGGPNQSGINYVYAAFAEQPFVTSGGVPATAH